MAVERKRGETFQGEGRAGAKDSGAEGSMVGKEFTSSLRGYSEYKI